MTTVVVALAAGYGVFLLYSALAFGWSGLGPGPARPLERRRRSHVADWMSQAGLAGARPRDFAGAMALLFVVAAGIAYVMFGGVPAALIAGCFAASFPPTTYRHRRRVRRAVAQEAWPRIIDEIRILTGSAGRSVPQALFEAGARAPAEMRGAFAAAHREWLISTDFARTLHVLKQRLADPTADAACETLLTAHDLGGTDLDQRLADLAADRRTDLQYRKDARARQAGVRFARRFVLIVPLGMAAAGLTIGNGRSAYETPTGQLLVAIALGLVLACWIWAGKILQIPEPQRVFDR